MKSRWLRVLIFVIGFLLCVYPLISSAYQSWQQGQLIRSFESTVDQMDETDIDSIWKETEKYNSMLFQTQGLSIGSIDSGILSRYDELLDTNENGIMSRLEIPKIGVSLPVYHGTEDEVLNVGAGHLEGTSLPTGGDSTHSVITGHRGLPNAKLFTRLDEIEEGDLLFLETLDKKLAYQVTDIRVVEPGDLDIMRIEPDRDLVSLVTCTPYGINTHRLVVTGERVEYSERQKAEIGEQLPGIRELVFMVLPFILLGYGVMKALYAQRNRIRKTNMEKNISAFYQEDPDGADLKTTGKEKEVKDTDEDD